MQVLEADPDGDISFFEFGCLSNSIEVISPKESGMEQELYKSTIGEAVGHIEFYQKEINTIRKKIETDVEREISAKVTAMKGITDSNGTGGDGKSHLTVK